MDKRLPNWLKAKDETIAILKTEIGRLHGEIGELLDRDKERNILFHKFQDALLLEATKQRIDTGTLTIQETTKQDGQEGRQHEQSESDSSNKKRKQKAYADRQTIVKPKQKLRKKGFFHGLSEK
jgi:hypothetical protein